MIFVTHAFAWRRTLRVFRMVLNTVVGNISLSPSPPRGKSSPDQFRDLHKNKYNTYAYASTVGYTHVNKSYWIKFSLQFQLDVFKDMSHCINTNWMCFYSYVDMLKSGKQQQRTYMIAWYQSVSNPLPTLWNTKKKKKKNYNAHHTKPHIIIQRFRHFVSSNTQQKAPHIWPGDVIYAHTACILYPCIHVSHQSVTIGCMYFKTTEMARPKKIVRSGVTSHDTGNVILLLYAVSEFGDCIGYRLFIPHVPQNFVIVLTTNFWCLEHRECIRHVILLL